MISIYSKKKAIIDLILNIYLLIISCLGIFVKRSSILAFSGGLYIGGGDIGISVTDIINYYLLAGDRTLQIITYTLLILLCIQIILNIIHYSKANEYIRKPSVYIQIIALLIWILLFILYGYIFNTLTTPGDYGNIRIYGTGLFGIFGLLGFGIVTIVELIWIGYYVIKSIF